MGRRRPLPEAGAGVAQTQHSGGQQKHPHPGLGDWVAVPCWGCPQDPRKGTQVVIGPINKCSVALDLISLILNSFEH